MAPNTSIGSPKGFSSATNDYGFFTADGNNLWWGERIRGDSDSFERASNAWHENDFAGNDEKRIYTADNGISYIVVEGQGENRFTYTNLSDLSNWVVAGTSISLEQGMPSPVGTLDAIRMYATDAAATHGFVRQHITFPDTTTNWTISVYAKKDNYRYFGLRIAGATIWDGNTDTGILGSIHVLFDFDTQSWISTASSPYYTTHPPIDCGNGWFRLAATRTLGDGEINANISVGFSLTNQFGVEAMDFDGTESVFVWHPQLERNYLTATSYIESGANSTFRSRDRYSMSPLPTNIDMTTQDFTVNFAVASLSGYYQAWQDIVSLYGGSQNIRTESSGGQDLVTYLFDGTTNIAAMVQETGVQSRQWNTVSWVFNSAEGNLYHYANGTLTGVLAAHPQTLDSIRIGENVTEFAGTAVSPGCPILGIPFINYSVTDEATVQTQHTNWGNALASVALPKF